MAGTGPKVKFRYPDGPITPAGAYHMVKGDKPKVTYRSYDDTGVFELMGPLSYFDRTRPERVELHDLKGLIPPWTNVTQRGATQDGETYITSLYDPLEVDVEVTVRGRDPRHAREVLRRWIDSWDAKQPGTLSWFTHELGYWWSDMRWGKAPVEKLTGGDFTRQKLTMVARCSDAFWRTFDTTDVFAFSYETVVDRFTDAAGFPDDYDIAYTDDADGAAGALTSDGSQAIADITGGRNAIARRHDFATVTDEQIITVTIGPIDPWPAATDTYLDVWARMNTSGDPGVDGVRLRVGYHEDTSAKGGDVVYKPFVRLSYFVTGTETVLREATVDRPWQPGDQISLAVGGYNGKLYSYYVQRGANPGLGSHNVTWEQLLSVVYSSPDGSHVGAAYRGAGFGMGSDALRTPPSVKVFTAGDSSAAEEAGYVTLYNPGDQQMWPYFVLVGPGIFGMGDGPNAVSAVTYGPLETNQMILIRTDPRRYGVVDLTSMPPPGTPAPSQYLSRLEEALKQYNAFLSNSGTPPPVLSVFGVPFPQGNPYSLLGGRFSRPIPPKQPGTPAQPQQIAVAVEGGGPTTAILAGGTPLRRFPQ